MTLPIDRMARTLRQNGICRFMDHFEARFPTDHLKDLVVDWIGPGRVIEVAGKRVVNFGSDSFLGLDQDERVQSAVVEGTRRWGTHNGASRAFASVRANIEAERKLAEWLGTDSTLIYPSVTLANQGAIPALVTKADFIAFDEQAHNSMQEGIKIAKANGTRAAVFAHNDPAALERVLLAAKPYRYALIAIDGVYSMSGALAAMRELNSVALVNEGVLYIDDAHGTGVLGRHGRGTVLETLGSYDNALVIGSLSKGFSCAGGFIGCSAEYQRILKVRSNPFIFGGPVPPPYLDAVCRVVEILQSPDYDRLKARLDRNLELLVGGARRLGLTVLGGLTPIVSILVGDEESTLRAGKFVFDRGYYVQSVVFPAVPYRAGVLRIQVNANHPPAAIEGLLNVLADLRGELSLPVSAA
jgi:7-keto-8-aminopelargonate synthetase-like enzyme